MNPIADNLIQALDISALSPEEQQEIISDLGMIIYQNVLMRTIEQMNDKDQAEFEKLLNNNSEPYAVFAFLKSKASNFEDIINEEASKLKSKTHTIMDGIGN
jgi:hypothetical protein